MRGGDLRHQITIQVKSSVPDGMGGHIATWNTFATCFAAIWPVSGKELDQNAQLATLVTHRVRIRYLAGLPQPIKPGTMQILYNSRIFNVQSVINWEERNIQLDMLCLELVT